MVQRTYSQSDLRWGLFLPQLLRIAGPIMLQSLLTSSLSFVDTLMIGQLGDIQIAAVGLANQLFFLIMLFFFGVSSGSAVFIAQFWGGNDRENIHRTMGIGLILSLSGALVFTLISLAIPQTVMRIFTPDPLVITAGATYLEVVGISYLFSAISVIFSASLRSTEHAQIPLLSTLLSLGLNVILNYLLIFGNFGFPQMGVAGAAVATALSRGLELLILLYLTYHRKLPAAGSIRAFLSLHSRFVKDFFHTTLPVILNEIAWSLGMVVYKIVFARMGTDVIAACNVVEAIQSLFFVIFIGTANGCAVMIGKKIGEKKIDIAHLYAFRFSYLALILGAVTGVFMYFFAPYIPRAFNVSPPIQMLAARSLMILSFVFPLKAFNMHSIVGILRSGGDTRMSLFIELTSVWCVGVPLALLGGLVWGIPLYYLYLLVGLEELYKLIIGGIRIRSGRWVNDLTRAGS